MTPNEDMPWRFQNSFDKEKLIGKKFHYLTVEAYSHRTHNGKVTTHYWNCLCVCGKRKVIQNSHVVHGGTKSCGCKRHSKEWNLHWINTPEKILKIVASIKPTESGCLEWPLTINQNGYGKTTYENKTVETHRLVWRLTNGEIKKGLVVRHKCNNPKCVNTKHLELGTPRDNAQDAVKAGTYRTAEKHHSSKLDWEKVRFIRKNESNIGTSALGRKYGVNHKTIESILKGRTWIEPTPKK